MKKNAHYWIHKLKLIPHPEGGFYKESYRDQEKVKQEALGNNFSGDRNYSTAIYYLLGKGDSSCFHRIKSDELWHFYAGDPVIIYYIENRVLKSFKLGTDLDNDEALMRIIPKNTWFAAELLHESNYALMGCTVSPGFDFSDFEKATKDKILLSNDNSQTIQHLISDTRD